ncbi:MAG: caspase family protein [Saprospiraceae bacterium]|nr:caspase family protein [Saprospiraceae bacterium]
MNLKFIAFLLLLNFFTIIVESQENPEIVVTSGHISNVYCINFSPNNRFVITSGQDKTVRVWDRSLCQEFRVLYGHSGSVWKALYTSDSKYIISIDDQGLMITWDHATGAILKRHKLDAFTRTFTYVPNTHRVLILKNGELTEIDIITGEITETYGQVTDPELRLTSDGKYLITKSPDKINSLSIYNYKTKQSEGKLISNHEMAPTSISISPDGNRVASFCISNQIITVWDLGTKQILSSFKFPTQNVLEMIFTPNNHDLLVIERTASIAVYGIKHGKFKRRMNGPSTVDYSAMQKGAYKIGTAWDFAISPDNKMVGIAQMLTESPGVGIPPEILMGGVLFDYKHNKELGRLKGYFKMATHLSVASNSKYILSSTFNKYNGIRVWNMKEGDLEQYIPTSGIAGASADGSVFGAWVLSNKEKPVLTVYNAKTIQTLFESNEVDALSDIAFNYDGTMMMTQEIEMDLANYLNNKYFFRIWDLKEKKQVGKRIEFLSTEMPIFKSVKLSPDGKYIIAQINSSEITCWEVASGKRIYSRKSQISYEFLLDFIPNSTKILISKTQVSYNLEEKRLNADMEWFEWNYTTGEETNSYNTGKEGILFSGDFSDDGKYFVTGQGGYFNQVNFNVVVWDWETKKPICEMPGHHGEINLVWYGSKGKRVYSSAKDGFIKIWEVESCDLKGSMIAQNAMDYIILSPDNYYKASKGNNEGIGFRFNNSLYTIDQFDMRFNRPDKVLTSLGVSKFSVKLYTKAWEKRISKMGFTPKALEGKLALPNIQIPNKLTLPLTTENKKLKINIKAWDNGYKLDRIATYVNDVPYPKLMGISLKNEIANKIERELDIDLSIGKNLIKVSVFNEQGLESLRESFQVNYVPKVKRKPDLYMFTIGVSEFEDSERNLKFAKKDATDLLHQFEKSQYFANVYSENLFNEFATKENVLKVSKFLNKAQIDDQIIIYISSHGLLDDQLDYYLAMNDVDFNAPHAKGLPYDALNHMLDATTCRNRLIMIDACHSGEVDKNEEVTRSDIVSNNSDVKINQKSGTSFVRPKAGLKNSFTYMKTLFNDVSKGTGATVISAAGGYEFALESEDWNNGVFTYAILEGLTSGDVDRNRDGFVYVSELKDYVTQKVVDLTDGKQHPTTRTENALNDFILYKIKHPGMPVRKSD